MTYVPVENIFRLEKWAKILHQDQYLQWAKLFINGPPTPAEAANKAAPPGTFQTNV